MRIPEIFFWHLIFLQRTFSLHVTRGRLIPPQGVLCLVVLVPDGHPLGRLLLSIVAGQGHCEARRGYGDES